MIKAAFFDIDGTLVSFKTHQISESTISVLNELRNRDIKIFIASGRHISAINNLNNQIFDGYVTLNGGMTIVDGKVIDKHEIDAGDIQSFVKWLNNGNQHPCVFVHENRLQMNYADDSVHQLFDMLNFPHPPIGSTEDALTEPVMQLIAFFEQQEEAAIMQNLPHCKSARWYPTFADIVPKGISKSVGMESLLTYFGIGRDETIAFGDGGNDVEMLQFAKIGVAMGNANDCVKQSADYVTTSVDDDGIYNAMLHFGII